MEFALFPNLPLELRLMVWERVPQPKRIIGLVTCFDCSTSIGRRQITMKKKRTCINQNHPDWRVRYTVQPRDQAIFPPLHACRESRLVWLPHYFQPTRYVSLADCGYREAREGGQDAGGPSYDIRFDVPFINYEADIFAMLYPLRQGDFDVAHSDWSWPSLFGFLDPFVGLDRSLIRQVALSEDLESLPIFMMKLLPDIFPSLREVTVLVFGARLNDLSQGTLVEIFPPEIQNLDCTLQNIPDKLIVERKLFNDNRLYHRVFNPRPQLRPLQCYLRILRAWLWHAQRCEAVDIWNQTDTGAIAEFDDFALSQDGRVHCPLVMMDGCGPAGHTFSDVTDWVPPFAINCITVSEKSRDGARDGARDGLLILD
ncbi:hypothetical protein NKR23_g3393 [Pleurostoma richardsiae]|uniref:2EXR domain-containing protein n=1 Tax=Pleurostoma richardsiae TaxID=41990 RepID=A0AA38S553_9PEZI|nr:hypothetical protein NKR23_g3393 [Pleurostoma richardsiae]